VDSILRQVPFPLSAEEVGRVMQFVTGSIVFCCELFLLSLSDAGVYSNGELTARFGPKRE
jgi:hypothetical protein